MAKNTHRDTVDCLLSELKDAYDGLVKANAYETCGDECAVILQALTLRSQSSIERAFQLASDLKAAQS